MKKIIGILGGMGPEATVNLSDLIVKWVVAQDDQDHLTTIVYNNTQIPNRVTAILGNGPSPLPALIKSAALLENAGAEFILMPCVTSHFYFDEIIKTINIPLLNIVEEVLYYIQTLPGNLKRIGLIATDGTIKTGLFSTLFQKHGLEIIIPDDQRQQLTMKAIYGEKGIKSGFKKEPKRLLKKVVDYLIAEKADAIIGGCTEIPLVLNQLDMTVPFINPLLVLAKSAIIKAGGQLNTLK